MEKGAILVGEPMGLFIAQEEGKLSDVSGYSMAVAGAEFNVAVGLARLDLPVTYLTRLGEDPFGQKIVRTLQRNGIGSEFVSFSKERSTGFMLKSKVSTGDPKIFYFRKGSAASTLSKEDGFFRLRFCALDRNFSRTVRIDKRGFFLFNKKGKRTWADG